MHLCSSLLDPANQWLAANADFEVVTCESVEIKVQPRQPVNNDMSTFFESGRFMTWFVRLLRYARMT